MILTNEQKLTTLQRILSDPLFAQSKVNTKLLTYLINCSIDETPPSEINIATHVFDKKDYDPSMDNYVRVYMYKLRKKLDQYYDGPGRHDPIKISIPKGHYEPAFISRSEDKRNKMSKLTVLITSLSFLTVVSILVAGYFAINALQWESKAQTFSIPADNPVWKEIFNSRQATALVFGHVFAYQRYQPKTNNFELVHNSSINSFNDLDTFIENHSLNPNHYAAGGWKILPASEVKSLANLQLLLFCSQTDYNVEVTSNLTWNDVSSKNIICIAHVHNLGILDNVIPKTYFQFKNDSHDNTSFIRAEIGDDIETYEFVNNFDQDTYRGYTRDYVLLTKLPGPHKTTIIAITSFHHIGRWEAIKLLTDPHQIDQLVRDMELTRPYFQVLLEVEGFERTAMKCNVLHSIPLDSDLILENVKTAKN